MQSKEWLFKYMMQEIAGLSVEREWLHQHESLYKLEHPVRWTYQMDGYNT